MLPGVKGFEEYILEHGEEISAEWESIQRDFSDESEREKWNILLDSIQADIHSELEELENKVDKLNEIDDEIEKLIELEEDDF
ncbi:MAG: hypothetical protein KJ737_06780 [Proteobacteria bacterium]|nr:hypothetical protein [Pseudomonadota bacterium]